MNKEGIKRIFNWLIRGLSYLCLIVLFLIAIFFIFYILSSSIAKAKGKYPYINLYTIVSPSMEPNIKVYDVIFVSRVKKASDLKIGDVITFHTDVYDTGGYTVTHRIYDINEVDGEITFITKGDNNQRPDEGEVHFEDIVGKERFKITGLGKVQFFISSKMGWFFIILIPALGIVLNDIFKLLRIVNIQKDMASIPSLKNTKQSELEANKKIRAVLEKARKFNQKR